MGRPSPVLGDPKKPINPKYFQSATWASHVKHEPGQQQFAKFVKNMVERIWIQASTEEEVRAFADLLGDEEEWNFLSVGVDVLKEVGAYDGKGPHASLHSQSRLLWNQVDEKVAARQEQIDCEIPLEERASIPYDDRIYLRKEDVVARHSFGFQARAANSERFERLSRSFEGFKQASARNMKKPVGQDIRVNPNLAAVRPVREASQIVTVPKPINFQDLVAIEASRQHGRPGFRHGYLTSKHPAFQPVDFNSDRPRRPPLPAIPDRFDLFDATGMPKITPQSIKPVSSCLPRSLDENLLEARAKKVGIVNGKTTRRLRRPSTSNQRGDSSSLSSNSQKQRSSRHSRRSSRGSHGQQSAPPDSKIISNRRFHSLARAAQVGALPDIAELSISNSTQSSSTARLLLHKQIGSNKSDRLVHDDEIEKTNDCPPLDLLVEHAPKLKDDEKAAHSTLCQSTK